MLGSDKCRGLWLPHPKQMPSQPLKKPWEQPPKAPEPPQGYGGRANGYRTTSPHSRKAAVQDG